MPTKNFWNLSIEKRTLILKSAKLEFGRSRFEQASINRIIQDAKISRGAFYYYFKDKEDIYWCLLESVVQEFEELMDIKEAEGDVFKLITKAFEFFIQKKSSEEEVFFKMLVENMKPGTSNFLVNAFYQRIHLETLEKMEMDPQFRYREKGDLKYLFNMLFSNFVISVSKLYLWEQSEEEARRKFFVSLDIIKYGAIKQEDETK